MKQSSFQPVWKADQGDGTYRNPILYADYADPDVIRVGSDFYMVSSSFSHVPGIPVLHSKDLIHWSILGHVLDRLDLPWLDRPRHGEGVWAPSIRYYDSRFWVFYATPDEGIFMCTAEKAEGPWSSPHLVHEVKGWIDPCPFWDEDGRAYLVHAFAHSRCGTKDRLQLIEMSPDGRALIGEGKLVFDGEQCHPTIEGPKLYKRGGYYYIFAPAGGVVPGWQTVLRSQSIEGPYEDRIVLHQGNTEINGPHQGGWIELESGESWFLHFQDRGAYGRIIHLQPMQWVNDWPVIGIDDDEDGIGEPVLHWTKPDVGRSYPVRVPATTDDFTDAVLGKQWQWQANPDASWYSLTECPGQLRLYAVPLPEGSTTLYSAPQLLLQKLPAPHIQVTLKLSFQPEAAQEQTGLTVFGITYSCLAITCHEGGYRLALLEGAPGEAARTERELWGEDRAGGVTEMYLRVTIQDDAVCQYSYSQDGLEYHKAGEPQQAVPGRWVGAKVGMFAAKRDRQPGRGYADIDWFRIDELP
ncbi:glycoside hydrolase family 43 protein [Paenibacillus silviterrae]|uniref:glycoside hydrolase family 43 protein n=1 Tax=Paenibacillus silviterrae TaxID=3242194 RepID=UPI00254353AD|nr:glycoside hydrolase 43 family protein [Paenibacillus chinjuensis]